jgi:protein arginine N-methyltransferase 1
VRRSKKIAIEREREMVPKMLKTTRPKKEKNKNRSTNKSNIKLKEEPTTTKTKETTTGKTTTKVPPESPTKTMKSLPPLKRDSQVPKSNGLTVSFLSAFIFCSDDEFKKSMFTDFSGKKDHDYYYGSYSNFYIHEEMLKDSNRTRAYQQAIENNPEDFKDKIVMDIGCGTGILSIFAARAGAKHVYAIENAEIAHFAREIIKRNGLEDKITVIKGKMEEIELPVKSVDIIISEWMGYFLLYESMLDCVLWARDKYLNKKTGKMLPDTAKLYIAAIEDGQYKAQKKKFWNNVYGVDMSVLTPTVMKEPLVDYVNRDMIMSDSALILDLDLVTCDKADVNFANKYSLKMRYKDRVHGLVGWFDTGFTRLTKPVVLSTSPYRPNTHWKQTVLYLEKDLNVNVGDVLEGSVAIRQSKENFRELDIKISYHMENSANGKEDFINMYKLR